PSAIAAIWPICSARPCARPSSPTSRCVRPRWRPRPPDASSRSHSTELSQNVCTQLKGQSAMSNLNRVILMGHLGADPELKTTQDGLSLLKMRLATSESWIDKTSKEREERTEWHDVTVFGARAE